MHIVNSGCVSGADSAYLALLTGRTDWQECEDVLSTGTIKDKEINELENFITGSLKISAQVVGDCIKIKKSDLPDFFPSKNSELDFTGVVARVKQLLQQKGKEEKTVNVWDSFSPEGLELVRSGGPSVTGYQFKYYDKGEIVTRAVTKFVLWRLSEMS